MRWLPAQLFGACVAFGCVPPAGPSQPQVPQATAQYQDPDQNAYAQDPAQNPSVVEPPSAANPAAPPTAAAPRWRSGRTHLGIAIEPLNDELRNYFGAPPDRGVLVAHVAPHSPAADAGVQVGDVMVSVGQHLIQNVDDARTALTERDRDALQIDVIRRGTPLRLDVMFAQPRDPYPQDVPSTPM